MELCKAVSGILVFALILLQGSTQGMTRIMEIMEKHETRNVEGIWVYKEFQIWNRFYNLHLCYLVVPPLVFFGMSILTLTNYGTIRLFGKVPIFVYLAFPVISVIASTFIVTVLPQATEVNEVSLRYLGCLEGTCFKKYERRLFRSLKPIGIRCASFGTVTTDWMVTIIQNIVDYKINLLLTF
ncbi:hypothetical protein Fcan01_28626 [Folsomia candida]|uniref:Uncharacterized protein n=1 Tax=Folsomia candida TaxID=158441 RepID=A0A226CVS8_FOLCA|nr:hypothetical protein Fcan01_28626 [Folsomia candida]